MDVVLLWMIIRIRPDGNVQLSPVKRLGFLCVWDCVQMAGSRVHACPFLKTPTSQLNKTSPSLEFLFQLLAANEKALPLFTFLSIKNSIFHMN